MRVKSLPCGWEVVEEEKELRKKVRGRKGVFIENKERERKTGVALLALYR